MTLAPLTCEDDAAGPAQPSDGLRRAAPCGPADGTPLPAGISLLSRHGRSFRLAGRLLPGATLADAAELYAFCRTIDDLADETADPVVAAAALRSVRRAILSDDRHHPQASRFLVLQDRTGAATRAAIALIDAVLQDTGHVDTGHTSTGHTNTGHANIGPVRIADEAALLRYAYGVAGTVGLMMCAVLDARTRQAQAHAIDLGIAMQLTNIARDVIDDAARDRLYLPADWLPAGLAPSDIPGAPEPVFRAVERLLSCADRFYRSAELGCHHLPPRVRPAIRAAARLYDEIGLRILRRGPAYLGEGRCVVPGPRRLLLLARSLAGPPRGHAPAGRHDPALHAALGGLPGTSA